MEEASGDHVDGGLVGRASPVSAALQVLVHVPLFTDMMKDDIGHMLVCRSVLCMSCALFKASSEIVKSGVADFSFFENLWRRLSVAMSCEEKTDPHKVLQILILRTRADLCERLKAQCCTTYRHENSPLTKIFEGEKVLQVECDICGRNTVVKQFLSVELTEELTGDIVTDLNKSLFFGEETDLCRRCPKVQGASILGVEVTRFPNTLIIHSSVASPQFKFQGCFAMKEIEYEFMGCIVDDSKAPFFVGLCPDGKIRMFKNAKITVTSPAGLYLAEYLTTSKLTLIYLKKSKVSKNTSPTVTTVPKNKQKCATTSKIKIVSYPSYHPEDDTITPSKYRSVGTQTDTNKVDTAVQTTSREKEKEKEIRGKKPLISFEKCKSSRKFKFFTGLSLQDFEILFNLIGGEESIRLLKLNYAENEPTTFILSKMSARDRLFMFLLRMRRGLPVEELSVCFGIEVGYVSELCYAVTRLVYLTLKSMEKEMFASAEQQVAFGKPDVMKPFRNLRVILDGASFHIERPSNFEQQGNTYSSYKSDNVLLVAIGISSHGATIFCSDAFEGCISDKESILKSGLLDMLDKGDGVMTDRGYDLTAELLAKGCHFYKPPSLGERTTLTAEEEILTKAIASARIYVEHAVADIKDWRILQGTIPINMIGTISNMIYIAAYFRNFNTARVGLKKKKKFVEKDEESSDEDEDEG